MSSPGDSVSTVRRYYLLKAQVAAARYEGIASTWWAKQEAIAGTIIPPTVPYQTKLAAAHYTRLEDLGVRNLWGDGSSWGDTGIWVAFEGASTDELVNQGLSRREADAVLRALGV